MGMGIGGVQVARLGYMGGNVEIDEEGEVMLCNLSRSGAGVRPFQVKVCWNRRDQRRQERITVYLKISREGRKNSFFLGENYLSWLAWRLSRDIVIWLANCYSNPIRAVATRYLPHIQRRWVADIVISDHSC